MRSVDAFGEGTVPRAKRRKDNIQKMYAKGLKLWILAILNQRKTTAQEETRRDEERREKIYNRNVLTRSKKRIEKKSSFNVL